jgi:hypothetical protein
LSLQQSMELLRQCRPVSAPNPGFLLLLKRLERTTARRRFSNTSNTDENPSGKLAPNGCEANGSALSDAHSTTDGFDDFGEYNKEPRRDENSSIFEGFTTVDQLEDHYEKSPTTTTTTDYFGSCFEESADCGGSNNGAERRRSSCGGNGLKDPQDGAAKEFPSPSSASYQSTAAASIALSSQPRRRSLASPGSLQLRRPSSQFAVEDEILTLEQEQQTKSSKMTQLRRNSITMRKRSQTMRSIVTFMETKRLGLLCLVLIIPGLLFLWAFS